MTHSSAVMGTSLLDQVIQFTRLSICFDLLVPQLRFPLFQ